MAINIKKQFSDLRKNTPKHIQWLLLVAAFVVVLILMTLLLTGKDEEFSERWEYGINVYEIVDEKVLKDLYGKEDVLLKLKEKYGVQYQLYFCTFLDLDMADVDGYGDNDISLSPKAMAFLSKIGASDYLRVMTYHSA